MRVSERGPLTSLAYEVHGSGPPLILLHGLSGSGRWWSRNVPAFASAFRTYAVDLPGFGASRCLRWSRLDDTVDRLADWIAGEGLSRAHIAGHSLGGTVAARLAARHPERVDRLVLVDAAIRPEGKRPGLRATDVVQHSQEWCAGGLRQCWCVISCGAIPGAPWQRRSMRCSPTRRLIWRASAPPRSSCGVSMTPSPPLALGRAIAESVANARLIVIPNTGHSPMWECARRSTRGVALPY